MDFPEFLVTILDQMRFSDLQWKPELDRHYKIIDCYMYPCRTQSKSKNVIDTMKEE